MSDINVYEDTFETSGTIKFLYESILGRCLLKILVQPIFSKVIGHLLNLHFSKIIIKPFIRKNRIDMSRYEDKTYISFNDFFKRELCESFTPYTFDKKTLYAPCDGKLSIHTINQEQVFFIKNVAYTLKELLNSETLAEEFQEGTILIFRLTPNDYHHYYFFDSGTIKSSKKIKGVLHTVRPVAFNYEKVFIRNSREVSVMDTTHFGKVTQVEVGALLVGKITNIPKQSFKFFDKKGCFEFGGSTIILLFKKNILSIEQEIINNSLKGIETQVRLGSKLGVKRGSSYA
jgi:Phosphatidylserine decarboxylase